MYLHIFKRILTQNNLFTFILGCVFELNSKMMSFIRLDSFQVNQGLVVDGWVVSVPT